MKAPFIVFEGVDGSGKSTACKMFADILVEKKLSVYSTIEPTNYEVGRIIRRYLAGEVHDPKELLFLFLADRCSHNVLIKKTINDGHVVVCDRYCLSTRIYQDGCVDEDLMRIFCNNRDINLVPDLLIYIDASINTIMERINSRSTKKDTFESTREKIETIHGKYTKVIRHAWKSYGKKLEVINSDNSLEDMNIGLRKIVDKHWNIFSSVLIGK
jgi:dTMP kinase